MQTPTFHASSAHILAGQLIAAFRDAEGRDCPAVSEHVLVERQAGLRVGETPQGPDTGQPQREGSQSE